MPNEVTYEVYSLANGRWILDARFNKDQRERAIDEGKQLAKQAGVEAVKVVRETYDDNDNLIKESTVYNSQSKPGGGGGGGGGGRAGADERDDRGGGDFQNRVEGFEDLESGGEEKGGGFSLKKAFARGDRDDAERAAKVRVPRPAMLTPGTGWRRPELILIYKMLIIGIVSFGFAVITTYVFLLNFA
jgi:hypothetical protein